MTEQWFLVSFTQSLEHCIQWRDSQEFESRLHKTRRIQIIKESNLSNNNN